MNKKYKTTIVPHPTLSATRIHAHTPAAMHAAGVTNPESLMQTPAGARGRPSN